MSGFLLSLFAVSAVAWERQAPADASEIIHPIFMLRHDAEKLAAFEATFYAVSDPGNERYGQHLTKEQVAAQLPPTNGAQDAVLSFLKEHDVADISISTTGDMITAAVSVSKAETMFGAKFHQYTNEFGSKVIRTAGSASLQKALAEKLYLVGNLEELPAVRHPKIAEPSMELEDGELAADAWPKTCGMFCKSAVTPLILSKAYNFGPAPTGQKTTMAVAEFQGQSWDQTDLDHFQTTCNLTTKITVDTQIGTNHPTVCKIPAIGAQLCLEALLDIQYIKAVAGDVPLTDVSDLRFSLLNWAKQVEDLKSPPAVVSISYGNDEIQQTSQEYMDAVNAQFMKLGAQGISVLAAAGDQGVWGRSGVGKQFNPDFPSSSPYITTVGGTDFAVKTVIGAEKAWASGGSGFSNHFPQPAYQKDAVATYIAAATKAGVLPPAALWNATGRAYPDVSALGGQQNPYCVAAHAYGPSMMIGIAGTSASCPVVAGLIARLNAERAAKGKSAMGFLNPFIYKNGGAFNDVKLGNTNGAGPHGFTAISGWDAATGFGTPDYGKLSAAAAAAVETVVVV